MITTLDVHRAVVALWDENGLDNEFLKYWPEAAVGAYLVLNDADGRPDQPMPYCVFDSNSQSIVGRTTGGNTDKRQRQNNRHPLRFSVQAKNVDGMSAKLIAGQLAEQIMKYYGGHPQFKPKPLTLTHGGVLLCDKVNDWGVRTGDEEHQWILDYEILTDIPVRI